MKSRQSKSKTARLIDAWLTTREHNRSTEQTNDGKCSQPKIEIHFNFPVGSVVLHADAVNHERREL